MIATIMIVSIAFYWLLIETDYLTIRLTRTEVIVMRLPSGVGITQADLDYLKAILTPKKTKKAEGQAPCWYCGNGHDRKHHDGIHPFDLCECGASIIIWSRKTRKANPNSQLAKAVGARFAPYSQANTRKMKAML